MIRLYAFELEFTCNCERMTRTMVASSEDNARHDFSTAIRLTAEFTLLQRNQLN